MKPQTDFQIAIKEDKHKLIEMGYSKSTLHSWMYGYRKPHFDTAIKLAQILGVNIRDIPYRQIVINRP
ncbi:unnamed protein product [marine sediment metagenome]|uniref:HTH cro/C1-type domain-containing protein n=1 Tax=marine sediment metagenome TaxID=412755 RepID=X0ZJ60_9ZZZZ